MSSRVEPRRPRRGSRALPGVGIVILACVLALAGLTGSVWGAFTAQSGNHGNQFVAASDWVAPTASASVIQKTEGGIPGYIRQGGGYRIYAATTDGGNPASGTASVAANATSITTGQTAEALSSGSFTIAGQSYNGRGPNKTVNATLAAGTYTYSLTSTDVAGNSRSQTGFPVIVDDTAPGASDVQSTNKAGNIAGHPDIGDSITLTYNELVDPNSVLSGWGGSATNVAVRIDNDVAAEGGNDALTVYNAANTAALPLGTVNLGGTGYVAANTTFGATGTASSMSQSTGITVTLGTASGTPTTTGVKTSMVWSPSAGATDRAGNPASTAARTQSGNTVKNF
jgi:hypothetical protein